MNLGARRSAVRQAEADCATRRAAIGAAWDDLKVQAGAAATPRRVVVAGLVAGFLAGWPRRRGKEGGSLLGGRLVTMLTDTVMASLGAAITAGMAAADAEAGAAPPDAASPNRGSGP